MNSRCHLSSVLRLQNSHPAPFDNMDLSRFAIDSDGHGRLTVECDPAMPVSARIYLEEYIRQTNKYRNISPGKAIRFSLYQPALNSAAGHRWLHMRLRRRFHRERIPQAVTVGVTKACQCVCAHCSADYHMNSRDRELSALEISKAIGESAALGVTTVILLGGEPLLRRDLESLVAAVDPALAQVVLFTNGEFLTEARCRSLVAAGLQGVFVSLDASNAAEHDALRKRPGLFDRSMKGIQEARAAGLLVAISSYLTTERVVNGVFQQMMELGRAVQAHEVTFFDAIPVGRMEQPAGSATDCGFLDRPSRDAIAALSREYRAKPDYPGVAAQSTLTSSGGSSFCFAANTQFYLSSTGHVCPCDFTPLSIGRFPESSIRALWMKMIQSPLYRKRSRVCRMQDPVFRARSVDRIPKSAALPYALDLLERDG